MVTFPYGTVFIGKRFRFSTGWRSMSKITIREVAKEAGVSIGTISRYLNPKVGGYVADETRRRIRECIERLRYVPNPSAQRIRGKKFYQIGLLTSDSRDIFDSRYHTHLLSGILDGIHESPYRMQIILLKEREYAHVEELLHEHAIDGLILLTWRIHPSLVRLIETCNKRLPVMLINDYDPKVKANFVYCDVREGMEIATHYLIKKGYRKIACLKGPALIRFGEGTEMLTVPSTDAHEKFLGFQKAMAEAGLRVQMKWVRECLAYCAEEGYRQACSLLDETERPEAILCANDEIALGCLRALSERRIACPGEVAVMGFDGTEKGALASPALTTIEQVLEEMGKKAAETLVGIVDGKLSDPIHVRFSPRLLVRASA